MFSGVSLQLEKWWQCDETATATGFCPTWNLWLSQEHADDYDDDTDDGSKLGLIIKTTKLTYN